MKFLNRKTMDLARRLQQNQNGCTLWHVNSGSARRHRSVGAHTVAVLLGALLFSWPAFYNGFPLLYSDSITYLGEGRAIASALFLHRLSSDYGLRSKFYSLGILPFHWTLTPWPIVGLQCLLLSWVLWLVVRSFAPRHIATSYLALVLLLSLLTSASWYAVFIMPDILGPVLYLAVYLLVFARETLLRSERVALYLIAWWGITAHPSHFPIAAGLCVFLALLAVLTRKSSLCRLRAVSEVSLIVVVAAALQMALYGYLYGKPTLNGRHPPFLMARIISDGPGRWYLEQHCAQLHWVVCDHLDRRSSAPSNFLWGPGYTYEAAPDSEKIELEAEEMPLVLATLRAYPLQQLSRSAEDFREQLLAFDLYGFNASPWILNHIDAAMPSAREPWLRSREAQETLAFVPFAHLLRRVVVASLVLIVLSIPLVWLRRSKRLAGLSLVVAFAVVANAFITGALSEVGDRYQCRVIWLIPLLAGICILHWLGGGHRNKEAV